MESDSHGMSIRGSAQPVDIVIPIYNAPDDVRRCVASVLACTPEAHRLVLIDDASTDAAIPDVLREIAKCVQFCRNALV